MPVNPEALYISACLNEKVWEPERDALSPGVFEHETNVYTFIDLFFNRHGAIPTGTEIKEKFPDFQHSTDVTLNFASGEMHDLIKRRAFHTCINNAHRFINEDNYEAAAAELARFEQSIPNLDKPLKLGESEELYSDEMSPYVPYADQYMRDHAGGISVGQMVTISAKTNVGKSFMLTRQAIHALLSGWNVVFFSIEMTAAKVSDRIGVMTHGVDYLDWDARKKMEVSAKWVADTGQSMTLYDSKISDVSPATVRRFCDEKTLIIIDHVGLMVNDAGERGGSGWATLQNISQELKQVALNKAVPIMIAAQERKGSGENDGTDRIGGSISIAQDSDLIISMDKRGSCETVRAYECIKNRNGRLFRWYTWFEPDRDDFTVIDRYKANDEFNSAQVDDSSF